MLKDILIKLRKYHNYTQEDLAEKINVSRQTISKWELGQTLPDIYNCQELCKIYNISLDELLQNDNIAPNDKFMFGYCKIDNDKKLHLYKDIILDPKDINYVYYEDTYVPKSIITDIGKVIIETSEKDYEYNYVDGLVEVVSELRTIVLKAKGEEK